MSEESYSDPESGPRAKASKRQFAAVNKNLINWPLVRPPTASVRWERSKDGADWVARLHRDKGEARVMVWLPIEQTPRLPSARDALVLLHLLMLSALAATEDDFRAAKRTGKKAIRSVKRMREHLASQGYEMDGVQHPRYAGKLAFRRIWNRRRHERKRRQITGDTPVPTLTFPSMRALLIALGRNPRRQGEWDTVVKTLTLWRDLAVRYRQWVGPKRTGDGGIPSFIEVLRLPKRPRDPVKIRLSREFFATRLAYTTKVPLPVSIDERSALQLNLAVYLRNWLDDNPDRVSHKVRLDRVRRVLGIATKNAPEQRRCIKQALRGINKERSLKERYVVTYSDHERPVCNFMMIAAGGRDEDRDETLSRDDQRRLLALRLARHHDVTDSGTISTILESQGV